MLSTDDKDLAQRLQRGDIVAFDLLYHRYAGKLYAFGMRYLKSAADAEELVQTVFAALWERHGKVDSDLSLKSYLFTIAYNEICRTFRSKGYLRQYIDHTLNTASESSSENEESLDFRSVLDQVLKILDKLPEKQKQVFLKSRIDGKSSREIASEFGLSPGTVDNYISDTMKYLRSKTDKVALPVIFFCFMFLF